MVNHPSSYDRLSAMQAVLKTAVEAGADSSRYPDSWIFHQKVGSKAWLLCRCTQHLVNEESIELQHSMQWESRGKGPKPKLDGKPIEYITVGGRVSLFYFGQIDPR